MELKIEKGVPIQPWGSGLGRGKTVAVIRQMEVGDSFAVPNDTYRSMHALFGQNGLKCTTRKQPDGTYRVWRIA